MFQGKLDVVFCNLHLFIFCVFLTGHFPLNLRSLENGFIFILVGHKAKGARTKACVAVYHQYYMNKAAFCQDLFNEVTDDGRKLSTSKIMIGHNPNPILKYIFLLNVQKA